MRVKRVIITSAAVIGSIAVLTAATFVYVLLKWKGTP